jgi:heme-degrading monooxygenase HmoA
MTEHTTHEISAEDRIAPAGAAEAAGPVTLINSFQVAPERDEAFRALWGVTSTYFTARPGFVSLRLHRAVSDEAAYRWVNVAVWESEAAFRAAHGTEEFRALVTVPGWAEFPSRPTLFQVDAAVG